MHFYPFELSNDSGYPDKSDFEILDYGSKGKGIQCKKDFRKGDFIARVSGYITHDITQYSLQISEGIHLNDIWFAGYLLHSSNPNVNVDMQKLELTAASDINNGDLLSMDYAATEDILYKQFAAPDDPRIWITGRKEEISEEGKRYIEEYKKNNTQ